MNKHLYWFDLIRGGGALLVCAGHLRNLIFKDLSELDAKNALNYLFYFLTSLGHQSVVLFFVLSGYFVGGSILKRSDFSWRNYLIARVTRLWVVLIPALSLTLLVDWCILLTCPEIIEGQYFYIWGSGPNSQVNWSLSLTTLVGNIFFLQTIIVPVFGTNDPLWSLACEFWYYLLFPLVVQIKRKPSVYIITILCLVTWGILKFFPSYHILGFFIWALGVFAWKISQKVRRSNNVKLMVICLTFILSVLSSKVSPFSIFVNDLILSISFVFLIIYLERLPFPPFLIPISVKLASISFSLYATHFPLMLIGASFCFKEQFDGLSITSFFTFALWMLLELFLANIFWSVFEKNTNSVKNYVENILKRKKL